MGKRRSGGNKRLCYSTRGGNQGNKLHVISKLKMGCCFTMKVEGGYTRKRTYLLSDCTLLLKFYFGVFILLLFILLKLNMCTLSYCTLFVRGGGQILLIKFVFRPSKYLLQGHLLSSGQWLYAIHGSKLI